MAEQENRMDEKHDAQSEAHTASGEQEGMMEADEVEVEGYSGGGFDPEQRRFLWTVALVLILGMGATSWIITSHDDRARQTYYKVNELMEVHRTWQQRLAQAEQADFQRLAAAAAQNDEKAYKAAMNDLDNIYMKERQAYADYHKAAGLEEVPVNAQTRSDFEDDVKASVTQRVEQYRRQLQAASTTQPATRPYGSMPQPLNP